MAKRIAWYIAMIRTMGWVKSMRRGRSMLLPSFVKRGRSSWLAMRYILVDDDDEACDS